MQKEILASGMAPAPRPSRQGPGAHTCLSPLPLVMFTSFSIPPESARALAFSMFLLVTSCRAQQMAATVSSDRMLGPLPPGSLLTRSRMAYLPAGGTRQGSAFHGHQLCITVDENPNNMRAFYKTKLQKRNEHRKNIQSPQQRRRACT